MSDHLPITIKLTTARTIASSRQATMDNFIVVSNPVANQLFWKMQVPQKGVLSVTDLQGKEMLSYTTEASNEWIVNDVSMWSQGTYYLSFISANGDIVRRKVVKL